MKTIHPSSALLWFCLALLIGCSSGSDQSGTVGVNLSLVVQPGSVSRQPPSASARLLSFLGRWLPGLGQAWAQSVSEITTIEVQITAPDLPTAASATVPVSNPTSGQVIPVTMQAPVGSNRTFRVAALNAQGRRIFAGSAAGVTLTAGTPLSLEITLTPTVTVTVETSGSGSGTITSSPPGIDCGATCSFQFEQGVEIALNAAAAPGSSFAGWSGDCSGTADCRLGGSGTVVGTFVVAVSTERLTVVKDGGGSGTVTSTPSGIACGGVCSADFPTGDNVTLAAAPTGGSTFTGWNGGGCSGTGACVVTMTGALTVTASFAAPPSFATLIVTKTGAGGGSVSSAPPGIDGCTGTCSAGFAAGSQVALTATPSGGATFAGWSGACGGTGGCVVVMNGAQSVTATFDPPPVTTATLALVKTGSGTGTVTSSPGGLDCGPTCSAVFPSGSQVTLTATPSGGATFAGWSGGGCGGTGSCVTTMAGDQTIVAQFDAAPNLVTLSVNKVGSGDGVITSLPGGIDCGGACQATFTMGTVVTLTAVPNGDSEFEEWEGGDCNGNGACVLTMDQNRSVNARFDED